MQLGAVWGEEAGGRERTTITVEIHISEKFKISQGDLKLGFRNQALR